jgi:hypothetical protein
MYIIGILFHYHLHRNTVDTGEILSSPQMRTTTNNIGGRKRGEGGEEKSTKGLNHQHDHEDFPKGASSLPHTSLFHSALDFSKDSGAALALASAGAAVVPVVLVAALCWAAIRRASS